MNICLGRVFGPNLMMCCVLWQQCSDPPSKYQNSQEATPVITNHVIVGTKFGSNNET